MPLSLTPVQASMDPFPFSPSDWAELSECARSIVNAELADDVALRESLFLQLSAILAELRRKHGDHPVLLETEADFEADPSRRLPLYQRAWESALSYDLPRSSIGLSYAAALLEDSRDTRTARQVLEACHEVWAEGDMSDRDQWQSLHAAAQEQQGPR